MEWSETLLNEARQTGDDLVLFDYSIDHRDAGILRKPT